MATAKKITVKHDEESPVPLEIMAQSIVAISAGIQKLRAGPLNERCLLMLIQGACPDVRVGKYAKSPVTQKQIKCVLDGISQLEAAYLKPKK